MRGGRGMKTLHDARWTEMFFADDLPEDVTPVKALAFISPVNTARRIQAALERTLVWAICETIGEQKLSVKDVRVCDHYEPATKQTPRRLICTELQVEVLDGWRWPTRVWTDEPELIIIEGEQ